MTLVQVQILDGRGLIWDAAEALLLRRAHRIVGEAVGALSNLKHRSAAHGLPILLLPEEVTLALKKGWIQLHAVRLIGYQEAHVSQSDTQQSSQDILALRDRRALRIPVNHGEPSHSVLSDRIAATWNSPVTVTDQQRFAVFQDLHHQGFYLTAGAKFGADFLAYPGDPMGYHALYCVRVVAADARMGALQLGAALRGAHAARKHLVLASVHPHAGIHDDALAQVKYVTFAPAAQFGA
ncbi:hypothetical protein WJX73_002431 [Symbiochloris irregularis]|uniref:tRNA-intron lyase n=1 Tax=Symbiochloris irregularis TaxID=706552 RepID=A0AAW1P154_9CHLO